MEFSTKTFEGARAVETNERFAVPMSEILDELFRDQDEIMQYADLEDEEAATQASREYVIEGVPTVEELRKLTELPFEVSITELDGKLVVSTGTSDAPSHFYNTESGLADLTEKRHIQSNLSFHSHPGTGVIDGPLPSLNDIEMIAGTSQPMLVASPLGLSILQFSEDVRREEIMPYFATLDEMENGSIECTHHELDAEYKKVYAELESDLGDRVQYSEYSWDNPLVEEDFLELFKQAVGK